MTENEIIDNEIKKNEVKIDIMKIKTFQTFALYCIISILVVIGSCY